MLAAVRVVGQHQNAGARSEHERHADQRLLLRAGAPLGPGQQRGAGECGAHGGRLHRHAAIGKAQRIGHDHPQPRHLCDGEVDEHDAAVEHLRAQRHVRGQHQQAGDQRQSEQAPVERVPVDSAHLAAPAAASSRSTVSSNKPNKSFAPWLPPTVNGNRTAGMPAFFCSHSDGRPSW